MSGRPGRPEDAAPPRGAGGPAARSVSEHVADPRHAAITLDGAAAVGEAAGPLRLLVRLGVWRRGHRVERARYRASACASLIAYAEVACALLEAGIAPVEVHAVRLRAELPGVHPVHHDRADLVAAAVRAAFHPPERRS